MRKHLTIGEFAKMMNLSPHTIRYYEKIGLINPMHATDSGYRLYDYEEAFRLSDIMLLRASNVSIAETKKLFESYTKEHYIKAMEQSYVNIEGEIKRLQDLKKDIAESLAAACAADGKGESLIYKKLSARTLIPIKSSRYHVQDTLKEVYDLCVKKNINMATVYKSDLHYILQEDKIILCVLDDTNSCGIESSKLPQGSYLSYSFFVSEDQEIESGVAAFFAHIDEHNIPWEGELVLIVSARASMVSQSGYVAELQIKVK